MIAWQAFPRRNRHRERIISEMHAWRVLLALLLLAPRAHAEDVRIQVNGRDVHLDVASPARTNAAHPTIVFESGLGTAGTHDWARVLPLLPQDLRVIRYDRPGLGGSAEDGESPTPRHIATVLHTALAAAGIAPPYVLVGHSLGGTRIRMFAGIYPDEVAGLVFVDPTPDFTRTSDDDLRDIFLPLGLGKKERDEMRAPQKPDPATPKPILAEVRMASAISDAGFAEIRALPPLRDIPVVVLAGDSDAEWPTSIPVSFDMHRWVRQWLSVRNASLRRFAASMARGTFVETTTSSHQIQNSEPGLVAWAIERVLLQLDRSVR
jgi:pimeloyl-ACP methyl ester carboxylesterase